EQRRTLLDLPQIDRGVRTEPDAGRVSLEQRRARGTGPRERPAEAREGARLVEVRREQRRRAAAGESAPVQRDERNEALPRSWQAPWDAVLADRERVEQRDPEARDTRA